MDDKDLKRKCVIMLIFIIFTFGCIIGFAYESYSDLCWKPNNKFLCQNKPMFGNVVQNSVVSSSCITTTCYSGYSKILYDSYKYCYITVFENQPISNQTAYSIIKNTYYIGEKVYIKDIENQFCSEFTSQKSQVITILCFMFLSIVPILLSICCIFSIVYREIKNEDEKNIYIPLNTSNNIQETKNTIFNEI